MTKTNEIAKLGKWGAGVRWTPLPQAEVSTEPAGEKVALRQPVP